MARSLMTLAVAALLLLAATAAPASAAVISAIFPRSGSLLGGQMLTITGSGFAREGTVGSTMAYIGNNQCKHIEVRTDGDESGTAATTHPTPSAVIIP